MVYGGHTRSKPFSKWSCTTPPHPFQNSTPNWTFCLNIPSLPHNIKENPTKKKLHNSTKTFPNAMFQKIPFLEIKNKFFSFSNVQVYVSMSLCSGKLSKQQQKREITKIVWRMFHFYLFSLPILPFTIVDWTQKLCVCFFFRFKCNAKLKNFFYFENGNYL